MTSACCVQISKNTDKLTDMNDLKKSTQAQVLRLIDLENILEFEKCKLAENVTDEFERELASWSASWRKEALEHYLPLGWSFALFGAQNDLRGYFLAQPQLFVKGLTQTLWVERLHAQSSEEAIQLAEIAYGIAREKHFQKVIFKQSEDVLLPTFHFRSQMSSRDSIEVLTSKLIEGV